MLFAIVVKLHLVQRVSLRKLCCAGVAAAGDECVKMAACFQPTLQTFKHRYVCVLCPELIHIYHNCNIDALVTTDRQF